MSSVYNSKSDATLYPSSGNEYIQRATFLQEFFTNVFGEPDSENYIHLFAPFKLVKTIIRYNEGSSVYYKGRVSDGKNNFEVDRLGRAIATPTVSSGIRHFSLKYIKTGNLFVLLSSSRQVPVMSIFKLNDGSSILMCQQKWLFVHSNGSKYKQIDYFATLRNNSLTTMQPRLTRQDIAIDTTAKPNLIACIPLEFNVGVLLNDDAPLTIPGVYMFTYPSSITKSTLMTSGSEIKFNTAPYPDIYYKGFILFGLASNAEPPSDDQIKGLLVRYL